MHLRFLFITLGMIGIMFASTVRAQSWDTIPPPTGGLVRAHARSGTTHYAVVEGQSRDPEGLTRPQLFHSLDDGDSWMPLEWPAGVSTQRYRMAIDGANCVYYMSDYALFRTTDSGTTWNRIDSTAVTDGALFEIATDSAGRLYVATEYHGLLLTTDRGDTWQSCTIPFHPELNAVAKLSCIDEDLYLWWDNSAGIDTLLRSTDHGSTWEVFCSEVEPIGVVDGGNNSILISGTTRVGLAFPFCILRTTTAGQQWDTLYTREIYPGGYQYTVRESRFIRSDSGVIAHAIMTPDNDQILLLTSDRGSSWTEIPSSDVTITSMIAFNARGHFTCFGAGFGMLRYRSFSSDAERTGFTPLPVDYPLTIADDGTVFAVSGDETSSRLYEWDGQEAQWEMFEGPSIRWTFTQVPEMKAVFLAPPDTVFATINGMNALGRTTDRGRHWTLVNPSRLITYANTSEQSGRWLGRSLDSLFLSKDNGRNWEVDEIPGFVPIPGAIAEVEGTVLLVRQNDLWRKAGKDSSWISREAPWGIGRLFTGRGPMLYARKERSDVIARTSNRGDSWEFPGDGYGAADDLLMIGEDTLIVLDMSRGLALSSDRGDSWTLRDLPDMEPRTIAVNDGDLYIGTQRLGILKTRLDAMLAFLYPIFPEDNATCVPDTVTLQWSASSLPGPFHVRCGTVESLHPMYLVLDTLVYDTAIGVGTLSPFTTYYWAVSHAEEENSTRSSTTARFTTTPLPQTRVWTPRQNDSCLTPDVEVTWDAEPCVQYAEIELSRDTSFLSPVVTQRVEGETSFSAVSLEYGRKYWLRVRSVSAAGAGPWSPVVSFRTVDEFVAAPLQSEPPDQATLIYADAPSIRWYRPDCVNLSQLQVSRDTAFNNEIIIDAQRGNASTYINIAGSMWTRGRYYWRVRALRDTVPGPWSPVWSFTLDRPLAAGNLPQSVTLRITDVFPVPVISSANMLTVQYQQFSQAEATIVLCDILGRPRRSTSSAASTSGVQSGQLDISSLPAGQYFLILRSGAQCDWRPITIVR
ncbi:hypothetical protein KQI65_10730 [bacterium]|nr:hypothetical protein [bacterium]